MKDNVVITRKKLTFKQTFSMLEKLLKENKIEISDVLDVDFSDEVEFLLSYKGRRLLCHIGKDYPYYIRFRLIGDRIYKKVRPERFVSVAKDRLLH